jgi:hypothetical protein
MYSMDLCYRKNLCNIDSQPPINFEAIVSADLTKEQTVIAAVSGITRDYVTLILNGEMYGAKNPIRVPIDWVTQNAHVISNR